MPQVEKASLRAEFDALKGRFERLCADGQLGAEGRALVEALLLLFELVLAVFMEKHTPKNSQNSSLPSSRTDKTDDADAQAGAKAKGRSAHHTRSDNTRTVETVTVIPVTACDHGGEDLRDVPAQGGERRTRIDIVFEKVVSHVEAEIKACPQCGQQTKGAFPPDLAGPRQYGPGLKAYVLHLLVAQMVALKRVQQTVQTLIDEVIAEATIMCYVMQLYRALAAWEQATIAQMLAQPTLHVDETSLRVAR